MLARIWRDWDLEPQSIAGGNVKLYGCCGKQPKSSQKAEHGVDIRYNNSTKYTPKRTENMFT